MWLLLAHSGADSHLLSALKGIALTQSGKFSLGCSTLTGGSQWGGAYRPGPML